MLSRFVQQFQNLKPWIQASRPRTLVASAVPVLVGASFALAERQFRFLPFFFILLAALCIQVATNFINDVYDFERGADTQNRIGPCRAVQAGLISPTKMKAAGSFLLFVALCSGLYLVWIGGIPILAIGLISIFCAYAYTAGPFPLAYLGLGDIFVFVFFGPVAAAGTFYIFTNRLAIAPILIGSALGMLSSAILCVNNLRDLPEDRESGKLTLAVRFGKSFAQREYIFLVTAAALLPPIVYMLSDVPVITLASSLVLVLAVPHLAVVLEEEPGARLNDTLSYTGRLLLLFGMLYSLALVLPVFF